MRARSIKDHISESTIMTFKLLTLIFVTTTCAAAVSAQSDTCRACNCQFNNVQVLNQLIEDKVTNALENGRSVSGVTYTRWGSSSCPNSTEAQLVYAGRAIGTKHNTQGGGAEKLCLPNDPDYLPGTTGHRQSGISHIHGAEYEFFVNTPNRNVDNQVAACAICHVPTRATVIMVPGKTLCPSSWTREYYGYLTTERETYYRSIFTCIDVNAEGVAGAGINTEGAHFYYAGTTCTGIACPPYEDNRILSCAVCTK